MNAQNLQVRHQGGCLTTAKRNREWYRFGGDKTGFNSEIELVCKIEKHIAT